MTVAGCPARTWTSAMVLGSLQVCECVCRGWGWGWRSFTDQSTGGERELLRVGLPVLHTLRPGALRTCHSDPPPARAASVTDQRSPEATGVPTWLVHWRRSGINTPGPLKTEVFSILGRKPEQITFLQVCHVLQSMGCSQICATESRC
ncbi:uncharacterized protein [Vulpes vulpes]|uniref:Uncharacterized protein isoform X4 n=1 Tax=Vulpes vulpes TaxID=9627 RepID=A0ABM5B5I3_VULVU